MAILASKDYRVDCTTVASIMRIVQEMGASADGLDRVYRLINVVGLGNYKVVHGSDILAAADISADNADRYQQVLDNADDIMQAMLTQLQTQPKRDKRG